MANNKREITDEKINIVMQGIHREMVKDISSDNEEERIAQLMILSIQAGYKAKILELEGFYLDYSNLNMNDKFHCTQIMDIFNSLSDKSKNVISRVLLNKFDVFVSGDEQ